MSQQTTRLTRNELRQLIKVKGHKIYLLSEKLGYSQGTLYGWLNSHREPSAKDMLRLAELLNIEIETIVRTFAEVDEYDR